MRTREELLNLSLPKWPQCIITGTKIPEEQALEIIRRTDYFFTSTNGNDKRKVNVITNILKIPDYRKLKDNSEYRAYHTASKQWKENWGLIELGYLYNDWILCDCIQGCQGWCNPDGTIDYHYNIGKWPECKEVLEELECIAKEWSFLELECTLMDGEYCDEDTSPVISFLVRGGEVEVVDPKDRNVHEEFNRKLWSYDENEMLDKFSFVSGQLSDSMISMEIIQSWTKFLKD